MEIRDTSFRDIDVDIRVLYLLVYALEKSSSRMKLHNLEYIADRYGFALVQKPSHAQRRQRNVNESRNEFLVEHSREKSDKGIRS